MGEGGRGQLTMYNNSILTTLPIIAPIHTPSTPSTHTPSHPLHTHTYLYVVSITVQCVWKLVRREELDTANTLSAILSIDLSAFSSSTPGMSTASLSCRTCGRVCRWEGVHVGGCAGVHVGGMWRWEGCAGVGVVTRNDDRVIET